MLRCTSYPETEMLHKGERCHQAKHHHMAEISADDAEILKMNLQNKTSHERAPLKVSFLFH